jgi:RNA polymerase sigma factor (sigma-70 family)
MSDDGNGDWELLQEYAQKGVHDAFARLVRRYVDLVYATCFRDLRDHHLAEDATQAVFLVLSRKAGTLRREVVLAGWLFQAARLVVRNLRKQEARRKARERLAAEMLQQTSSTALAWGNLSPLLSDGLEKLGSKDRDAVLLHYFQHKTLAEVGTATGVSEDAARMRISRAVRKLRAFFSRKGQTLAIGAIATLLMANSLQAAPPSCSASVVAAVCGSAAHVALAGSSAAVLANATLKSLFTAKVKMAAAVTAISLLVPAAGLATYRAIATRPEDRQVAHAQNMLSEGVALGPAPVAPMTTGKPAPVSPTQGNATQGNPAPGSAAPRSPAASSPAASSPAASSPAAGSSKQARPTKPQPAVQSPARIPEQPLTDRLLFRLGNGLLTVAGPAAPADGQAARIVLRGLPGETTIAREANGLRVENHRSSDTGEIRTRIVYQPGASLEIQRSVRPRSGKEYAVMFRQNHGQDPTRRAGQTTVRATSDGGENWTSWAADDFPRILENYPLAYFAHLVPVFRDFSARHLCTVPAAVARKVFSEAKAAAHPPALADLLKQGDNNRAAILWRREIEMLNRDVAFLVDCLESDELDVRSAALKQLSEVTGKTVAFDVAGPIEKRKAMLNELRREIGVPKNAL